MKNILSVSIQAAEGAEQVKAYFDWANPLLCVDPADPYMAENYPPDRVADEIARNLRCLLVVKDGGAIIGGAMAKVFNDQDRSMRKITDPDPIVLFEYTAVHEDYRRQGLYARLFARREQWARELGFGKLVMEIELSNPESLRLAFRNGFLATHLLPPGLGIVGDYLILTKALPATDLKHVSG